jgi:hypothetical protein
MNERSLWPTESGSSGAGRDGGKRSTRATRLVGDSQNLSSIDMYYVRKRLMGKIDLLQALCIVTLLDLLTW